MNTFGAHSADHSDVYLGAPIMANRVSHFSPLMQKIERRIQPWKSALLSPAGKLTLIKAVIKPTLLYAMQTSVIPVSTLKQIQAKVRSFFWNKGADRRMPLVAWEKITMPKSEGGLGLKDYILFAKTVQIKYMWGLVSENRSLWGDILKAKYLSRSVFWSSTRTTRCTKMWRAMLTHREDLAPHIRWLIGNGKQCPALAQPWHDLWRAFHPKNAVQR